MIQNFEVGFDMDVLVPEAGLHIVRDISSREGCPAMTGQFPMAV
jgi:hypothetical protein